MPGDEQFKDLDMKDLIGSPLLAAAKADAMFANKVDDFLETVKLEKNSISDKETKEKK